MKPFLNRREAIYSFDEKLYQTCFDEFSDEEPGHEKTDEILCTQQYTLTLQVETDVILT